MVKKVIDIISIENKSVANKHSLSIESEKKVQKPVKNFFKNFWLFLVVILIVSAGVFIFLSFQSKVDISLLLTQEEIKITKDLKVDGLASISDFGAKTVQGTVFNVEKIIEQTFQSTGQDEKGAKATGIIRVFNKRNPPASKMLVAQTRFLSSDGKTFKALKKMELPPATFENGKLVASYLDVEVEAQEPGEAYNIGPSKFSVPGLVGSALYYDIWGESTAKMEGGSQKAVKKVIASDLQEAKNSLENSLEQEIKKEVSDKAGEEFIVQDKAISLEPVEITCAKKEGEVAEEFVCQGKVKAQAIAVKVTDLKDFAYHFISDQISSSTNFRMETVVTDFIPKNVDFEANTMDIELTITSKTYQNIDRRKFIEEVLGKSQDEAQSLIMQRYHQVEKAEFNFWPFWIKSCPNNPNRVEVGFRF
jgi:hypothetical protein